MARTRRVVTGMAAALALLTGPLMSAKAGAAEDPGVHLVAHLSGLNEAPAVGDGDGIGGAHLTVRWGEVCWEVRNLRGVATPTAAHIHRAAIGAAGPVVVDFKAALSGCTPVDPDLTVALVTNPQAFYVNIHTADFSGGAVRGQLNWFPLGPGAEYRATLSGANEVGAGGDADASGQMVFLLRGTVLCWRTSVSNVATIAANHIHNGAAGTNGPVVANFGNQLSGCRDVPEALLEGIVFHTDQYYGNVHNAAFPGGAARGQLVFERLSEGTPDDLD